MPVDMDALGAALRGGRIPTWDEGIAKLAGKLHGLVAAGDLTINDARTIDHLVSSYYEGESVNDCNS